MQEYDDDLLAHVDHIHDPAVLKRLLIQKEQERQGLSLNLDMAARLGLDLHQQLQRCEIESAARVCNSCNLIRHPVSAQLRQFSNAQC